VVPYIDGVSYRMNLGSWRLGLHFASQDRKEDQESKSAELAMDAMYGSKEIEETPQY